MKREKKDELYYLEEAPVSKSIFHMCIPMIMALTINMIYNITDAYFIGKFNNTQMLAAVTLAMPFTIILMALGDLFGAGGSTYISRLIGEKDLQTTKKVSSTTFYLTLITGVVFMIICLPFLNSCSKLLGANGQTLKYLNNYIGVFAIGSPFMIAFQALDQMVRSEGSSEASMIGMFISILANIVLDPLFIFGFSLGVQWAAIATVVGNILGILYYLHFIIKKTNVLSISLNDFKIDKTIITEIFKIGISSFLLAGFLLVSCLMFNYYSVLYGENVVAGFGIAQRVVQMVECIGMGLYMGVTPLIAVAYSSNNKERLLDVLKKTAIYLVCIVGSLSLILFVFRSNLVSIFTLDHMVIKVGSLILTAQLISAVFAGSSGLIMTMFQAFGKALPSTVMSLARGLALIPVIILGNMIFKLDGVIWSLPISELIATLIGVVLLYSMKRDIFKSSDTKTTSV